jgi:DNA repair exonuclease SbcCD ATPase subunit
LLRISIRDFRGIVDLTASPNGKSLTLRGKNGAGKSSAVDALWWGLGGNLDGEVVRNGAEAAKTEIAFGDYLIQRRQVKGKKPALTVKSADGKATFNSPTALLAGFIGAIERRTFTTRPAKEQTEILRRLAPGLDCSDLDARRAARYDERTEVNREAKSLRAQADGVALPDAPAEAGEEIDLAIVAGKKADVERQRAANAQRRRDAVTARAEAVQLRRAWESAGAEVDRLREALRVAADAVARAEVAALAAEDSAAASEARAAAAVDPDTTIIDREIAEAKAHNARVRQVQQLRADRARAEAERQRLAQQADAKEAAARELTCEINRLDAERAVRIAQAKCPVRGLAITGEVVTYDGGKDGPVEARLGILNDAACVRLDVEVAAALGHHLVAIRNAERLDPEHRLAVEAFAAERGVQLVCEVRTDVGAIVEAVIEDGVIETTESTAQQEIEL